MISNPISLCTTKLRSIEKRLNLQLLQAKSFNFFLPPSKYQRHSDTANNECRLPVSLPVPVKKTNQLSKANPTFDNFRIQLLWVSIVRKSIMKALK